MLNVLVIVFTVCLVSTCSNQEAATHQRENLDEVFTSLQTANPWASQFCVRGAALEMVGRHQEADQYQRDFGNCIELLLTQLDINKG
ncbi:hypothetical protein [Vibrio sp. R78045]|uniref:hypothetical protein n=1 Tax=Vibrio sp. R78045 TaxID=3093868 RepID=UPI0036F2ED8D